MERRTFIGGLTLGLLASPLAVQAQPGGKVYRIGFLASAFPLSEMAGPDPSDLLFRAFVHGLRDLNYLEGQNLVIERRSAEGRPERLAALATELVRLKVDVIVVSTSAPARAAKDTTSTIPIVFCSAADPVAAGLVASLARPGGNATGLSDVGADLAGKLLEMLREAVPGLSRVGVLWNRTPGQLAMLRELEAPAQTLGISLHAVELRVANELEAAFAGLTQGRPGGLLVLASPLTYEHRGPITRLAAKHRLPAVYEMKEFADTGGLMSYGPSRLHLFRRAAVFVDKILKGAKPADLPVEQPTKFELVINLKTAKALGLTIPPSVLLQATEIIE